MQKIVPFLWFDNQAEAAANFYVSLFKNSKINSLRRYGDAGPGPFEQPMDTYQWLLFISAHSERHTKQIAEVKADPNFPKQ